MTQKEIEREKKDTIKAIINLGKPSSGIHLPFRLAYDEPVLIKQIVYSRHGTPLCDVNINLPKGYIFASHNHLETAEQHVEKVIRTTGRKVVILPAN